MVSVLPLRPPLTLGLVVGAPERRITPPPPPPPGPCRLPEKAVGVSFGHALPPLPPLADTVSPLIPPLLAKKMIVPPAPPPPVLSLRVLSVVCPLEVIVPVPAAVPVWTITMPPPAPPLL